MRAIQVSCPATVKLFYNINGFDYENNKYIYTSVNQMINLYDKIVIRESHFYQKGITIKDREHIFKNDDNVYCKTCKLFFEYTGINYKYLVVEIEKNIPINSGFSSRNSDVIGLLYALNIFYKTNLTGKDLMKIASKIDRHAPLYLYGDLSKIDMDGISPVYEHYYNDFIIALSRKKDNNNLFEDAKNVAYSKVNYDNKKIFNCLNDMMPDELKKMRDYLLKYNEFNHGLMGMSGNYLIAFPDDKNISNLFFELNNKFPNYKLLIKTRATNYKFLRMFK